MCENIVNHFFIVIALGAAILLSVSPLAALYLFNEDSGADRPFYDISISASIDQRNTPYPRITDSALYAASFLLILLATGREVQIRVIFERAGEYTGCIPFLNVFNALLLIIGGIGYGIGVYIDDTDNETIHMIAASVGWVAALVYQLIHIILTFYQRCKCSSHYDSGCCDNWVCRYIELIYLLFAYIISVIFSVIFIIFQLNKELYRDTLFFGDIFNGKGYFFEWLAFWLINSFYIVLAIIFYRDPIDDELKEFFLKCGCVTNCRCDCCMCCCNKNKYGKNVEMQLNNSTSIV